MNAMVLSSGMSADAQARGGAATTYLDPLDHDEATNSFDVRNATRSLLRFSTVTLAALGVVVVTGLVNSFALVGSLAGLIETEYGHWLMAKIAVAAGVLHFRDALPLVRFRAQAMQDAVPPGVGAMAAILMAEDAVIAQACADAAQGQIVAPANFNSPGQTVIAGICQSQSIPAWIIHIAASARKAP